MPGCAADEARFASEAGCRRIGSACGSDDWATDLPGNKPLLFVRAGAAAGGQGTRAAPYATIAEAMSHATSGTVIAVGKGTYAEAVVVRPGVTVFGACVAQTQVMGSTTAAAFGAAGLNTAVTNLRIGGPRFGVVLNPSGRSLHLSHVLIDGAGFGGILVGNTAQLTGHDVVVRNTALAAAGPAGRGLSVEYAGTATLERVVFENNRGLAMNLAERGSKVTLTDAVIRGTRSGPDGTYGRAATVNRQAQLSLTRAVLENNQEVSLVAGPGADLQLSDVLVRGTLSSPLMKDAGGGLALDGATATLTRVVFSHNRWLAISLQNGAALVASHVVVSDTDSIESSGEDGAGLDVSSASRLALDHAFIGRSKFAAIGVTASTGSLRDVDVRDVTAGPASDQALLGIQLAAGAVMEVARLRISHAQGAGLIARDAHTQLRGTDLIISDTGCRPDTRDEGAGLAVVDGAVVALTRTLVSGSHTVALEAADQGTRAQLDDLTLRDTASDERAGEYGRGIHAHNGAKIVLVRASVERSADVGVFVGSQSSVEGAELWVGEVAKRACVNAKTCADVGGAGVVAMTDGASFIANRFGISRSVQCGLLLAEGGIASLEVGEVSHHPIGACVQTDGFDLARISDRVSYLANERKLDAQFVPLPETTMPKPRSWGATER